MSRPQAAERLTMRMKPLISSARDLFSSSRVRALRDKDNYLVIDNTQTHTHTQTDTRLDLLDRVVHGLADVQQSVEDDRVSGGLQLVSDWTETTITYGVAGQKHSGT